MKLAHFHLDKVIDFNEYFNWILIIENPNEFYSLSNDIFIQTQGQDGQFILSENNEILKFDRRVLLFYDYFNLEINTKKNLTELNNQVLLELKNGDYITDIYNINQMITKLNSKIINNFDENIFFDNELTFEKFIKISNYHFDEMESIQEKLIHYIDILSKLKNIKLVIFINIGAYLSESQIKAIVKDINYMQIKILFIESNKKFTLKSTKTIIIDDDLCEI